MYNKIATVNDSTTSVQDILECRKGRVKRLDCFYELELGHLFGFFLEWLLLVFGHQSGWKKVIVYIIVCAW